MIRVLITGGAGFIGSEFVNLYAGKYDLHVIDKLTYAGNLENIKTKDFNMNNLYKVDISNYNQCYEIFKTIKPEIVINFAAESHVDNSINSSFEFLNTNEEGLKQFFKPEFMKSLAGDKGEKVVTATIAVRVDENEDIEENEGDVETTTEA